MTGSAAFDAGDWLSRFQAAGGHWLVQGGKVQIGWSLAGPDEGRRANAIWAEIELDDDKRTAVQKAASDRRWGS